MSPDKYTVILPEVCSLKYVFLTFHLFYFYFFLLQESPLGASRPTWNGPFKGRSHNYTLPVAALCVAARELVTQRISVVAFTHTR